MVDRRCGWFLILLGMLSVGIWPMACGAQEAVPTRADVAYGSHPRQVLDFYQAQSATPAPVLICFHGGGFVSGDKSGFAKSSLVRRCLSSGISVVSANYRFVVDKPGEPGAPYPAPMLDGARVVQFVRSMAPEWLIDPDRIALTGGSAGACMAIWMAVRDDLADPDSDDPVARLSTRVSGVIGQNGQTTLDPHVILKYVGGNPMVHSSLKPFYGISSVEELDKPEVRRLVDDASALNFASADDPPLYLDYRNIELAGAPLPADAPTSVSIHHPMFGKLMCDQYAALGLTCVLVSKDKPSEISPWMFLTRILGMERQE